MKLSEIIEKLSVIDGGLQVKCLIDSVKLESNVYVVGQVQPDFPGVSIGDREPHLREKLSDSFVRELKTFGDRFQNNDFILKQRIGVNDVTYETRCFRLSTITWNEKYLFLKSLSGEIIEFRERHEHPECE